MKIESQFSIGIKCALFSLRTVGRWLCCRQKEKAAGDKPPPYRNFGGHLQHPVGRWLCCRRKDLQFALCEALTRRGESRFAHKPPRKTKAPDLTIGGFWSTKQGLRSELYPGIHRWWRYQRSSLTSELDAFCGEHAHTACGILPNEEKVIAISTISVIITNATPSGNTPFLLRKNVVLIIHTGKKRKESRRDSLFFFWSKCGDSNSRPPVPEAENLYFLTIKLYIYHVYSAKSSHFARLFRYSRVEKFLLWSVMWSNLKYGWKRKTERFREPFSPLANPTRVKKYTRNICLVCCIRPLKRRKSKSFWW